MSRRLKLPQMRFHRTNRLVYVRLDGKMVYLGVAKVGDGVVTFLRTVRPLILVG